MSTMVITKKELLHSIARDYVIKGLGEKNFDAIPYAEGVELRAPICPGGSERPLTGKENLRNQWWAPLPMLVGKTTVIDSFVNEDATTVAVEFHCEILNPSAYLIPGRSRLSETAFSFRNEFFHQHGCILFPKRKNGV